MRKQGERLGRGEEVVEDESNGLRARNERRMNGECGKRASQL